MLVSWISLVIKPRCFVESVFVCEHLHIYIFTYFFVFMNVFICVLHFVDVCKCPLYIACVFCLLFIFEFKLPEYLYSIKFMNVCQLRIQSTSQDKSCVGRTVWEGNFLRTFLAQNFFNFGSLNGGSISNRLKSSISKE